MSANNEIRAATEKLCAARARLVLERPFIGALVLYLPLVPHARCRSVATDGRSFFFRPEYVARLTFGQVQFVLAHEALHCALGHFARRGFRLRGKWDAACDYAVNSLLAGDGLSGPAGTLLNPAYEGLAAEEIYPLLADVSERTDEHWFGAGCGSPADSAASRVGAWPDAGFDDARRDGLDEIQFQIAPLPDAQALASEWRRRLASSALEAQRAGRLAANWRRVLSSAAQPRLPWQALLARFLMAQLARDDYSFTRRGRRDGEALLPGMQSGETDLAVAIDTSGSIARQDLEQFVSEVSALAGQVRARVSLVLCDAEIAPGMPLVFGPWEPIRLPEELGGGGGTRFTPVFSLIESQSLRPDALVYFTDGQGEFPSEAPAYPVLWVVKGTEPVPFGERAQL